MSMYLFDLTRGVLFEWDCEQRESREGTYTWTEREVESGAPIVNHGVKRPEKWTLEGLITATPLFPGGIDFQRVMDADSVIRELADALQPVSFVSGWYVGEGAITRIRSTAGTGDPLMLNLAADFKEIRVVSPATTQIPASRLKPKVRRRATPTPPAAGGASTGTPPTPKQSQTGARWLAGKAGYRG